MPSKEGRLVFLITFNEGAVCVPRLLQLRANCVFLVYNFRSVRPAAVALKQSVSPGVVADAGSVAIVIALMLPQARHTHVRFLFTRMEHRWSIGRIQAEIITDNPTHRL